MGGAGGHSFGIGGDADCSNMMTEYRCRICSRLLFLGNFVGNIGSKCPRCNEVNDIAEHVIPDERLERLPSVERERHPSLRS